MRAGLNSHQQRLRLSDLGHLVGWRETFERGHEGGASVGGAAGRLIELGERKRREKLVTARGLLLCDGDGGSVGVFGGRGIGGIAFEQDFAAQAMEVCIGEMLSRFFSDCQSPVDLRESSGGFPCHSLKLSKRSVKRRCIGLIAWREVSRQRLHRRVSAYTWIEDPTTRPIRVHMTLVGVSLHAVFF